MLLLDGVVVKPRCVGYSCGGGLKFEIAEMMRRDGYRIDRTRPLGITCNSWIRFDIDWCGVSL